MVNEAVRSPTDGTTDMQSPGCVDVQEDDLSSLGSWSDGLRAIEEFDWDHNVYRNARFDDPRVSDLVNDHIERKDKATIFKPEPSALMMANQPPAFSTFNDDGNNKFLPRQSITSEDVLNPLTPAADVSTPATSIAGVEPETIVKQHDRDMNGSCGAETPTSLQLTSLPSKETELVLRSAPHERGEDTSEITQQQEACNTYIGSASPVSSDLFMTSSSFAPPIPPEDIVRTSQAHPHQKDHRRLHILKSVIKEVDAAQTDNDTAILLSAPNADVAPASEDVPDLQPRTAVELRKGTIPHTDMSVPPGDLLDLGDTVFPLSQDETSTSSSLSLVGGDSQLSKIAVETHVVVTAPSQGARYTNEGIDENDVLDAVKTDRNNPQPHESNQRLDSPPGSTLIKDPPSQTSPTIGTTPHVVGTGIQITVQRTDALPSAAIHIPELYPSKCQPENLRPSADTSPPNSIATGSSLQDVKGLRTVSHSGGKGVNFGVEITDPAAAIAAPATSTVTQRIETEPHIDAHPTEPASQTAAEPSNILSHNVLMGADVCQESTEPCSDEAPPSTDDDDQKQDFPDGSELKGDSDSHTGLNSGMDDTSKINIIGSHMKHGDVRSSPQAAAVQYLPAKDDACDTNHEETGQFAIAMPHDVTNSDTAVVGSNEGLHTVVQATAPAASVTPYHNDGANEQIVEEPALNVQFQEQEASHLKMGHQTPTAQAVTESQTQKRAGLSLNDTLQTSHGPVMVAEKDDTRDIGPWRTKSPDASEPGSPLDISMLPEETLRPSSTDTSQVVHYPYHGPANDEDSALGPPPSWKPLAETQPLSNTPPGSIGQLEIDQGQETTRRGVKETSPAESQPFYKNKPEAARGVALMAKDDLAASSEVALLPRSRCEAPGMSTKDLSLESQWPRGNPRQGLSRPESSSSGKVTFKMPPKTLAQFAPSLAKDTKITETKPLALKRFEKRRKIERSLPTDRESSGDLSDVPDNLFDSSSTGRRSPDQQTMTQTSVAATASAGVFSSDVVTPKSIIRTRRSTSKKGGCNVDDNTVQELLDWRIINDSQGKGERLMIQYRVSWEGMAARNRRWIDADEIERVVPEMKRQFDRTHGVTGVNGQADTGSEIAPSCDDTPAILGNGSAGMPSVSRVTGRRKATVPTAFRESHEHVSPAHEDTSPVADPRTTSVPLKEALKPKPRPKLIRRRTRTVRNPSSNKRNDKDFKPDESDVDDEPPRKRTKKAVKMTTRAKRKSNGLSVDGADDSIDESQNGSASEGEDNQIAEGKAEKRHARTATGTQRHSPVVMVRTEASSPAPIEKSKAGKSIEKTAKKAAKKATKKHQRVAILGPNVRTRRATTELAEAAHPEILSPTGEDGRVGGNDHAYATRRVVKSTAAGTPVAPQSRGNGKGQTPATVPAKRKRMTKETAASPRPKRQLRIRKST